MRRAELMADRRPRRGQ